MSVGNIKIKDNEPAKYTIIEDENGKKLKRYCERHL